MSAQIVHMEPQLPGVPSPKAPRVLVSAPAPRRSPWREQARFALEALLHSYSQVLFARSLPIGAILLVASFVVPSVGIVGLAGVVLSASLAMLLQLNREAVRTGVLGYNALLVFLGIGALLQHGWVFWGLAAVAAMLIVLVHVSLAGAMGHYLRLPVLSVPFVLAFWLIIAAVPHIRGMAFGGHPPAFDLGAFPGPELLDTLLRSLGAIFFQPHWTAGALVLLAMLLWSRIAVVHAMLGFAVAVVADQYLFTFPPDYVHLYIGFNFIMTAVALGGIFYVPSGSSLALSAAGTLTTGLISVGFITLLAPVGLPVLAAPFNVAVLIVLYALGQRSRDSQPRSVDFVAGSPEANLNWYRTRIRRFRTSLPVRMVLPFRGAWTVTQGHDGDHTHRGDWRHGLDFEVFDRTGRRHRGTGAQLSDWFCYRLPVTAPAAGTVVRVVEGVPDNAIGDVNVQDNWGNLVLIQHAPELFSMVAHLSPGSIKVREGQTVIVGEQIGLCGASGRSPVPHLHFQLQASSLLGSATVASEFHGIVIEQEDGSEALAAESLPQEKQRVRNVGVAADIAERFRLPPGHSFEVEVTEDGVTGRTELTSGIDLLGNRWLKDATTDSTLWFDNRGDSFIAYDVDGPRRGALLAFYTALARAPFDGATRLVWSDKLEPRRLTGSLAAWAADALGAFIPAPVAEMTYASRRDGGDLVIEGHTRGSLPLGLGQVDTVATLGSSGSLHLDVRIGTRHIVVSSVEDAA